MENYNLAITIITGMLAESLPDLNYTALRAEVSAQVIELMKEVRTKFNTK